MEKPDYKDVVKCWQCPKNKPMGFEVRTQRSSFTANRLALVKGDYHRYERYYLVAWEYRRPSKYVVLERLSVYPDVKQIMKQYVDKWVKEFGLVLWRRTEKGMSRWPAGWGDGYSRRIPSLRRRQLGTGSGSESGDR